MENMMTAGTLDFNSVISDLQRIAAYATREAERLQKFIDDGKATNDIAATIARHTASEVNSIAHRADDTKDRISKVDGEHQRFCGAINAYNTSRELAAKREHDALTAALKPADGTTLKRPPTYKAMLGVTVYSDAFGPGTVTNIDGYRSFTVTFDYDIPRAARGFRNRPYNSEEPNDIEFYNRERVAWLKPTTRALPA